MYELPRFFGKMSTATLLDADAPDCFDELQPNMARAIYGLGTRVSTLGQARLNGAAMTSKMPRIDPEKCMNMAEVRAGVDAVDQEIVSLLANRFAYMDAAARIKRDRDQVRDEDRKAKVIENVRLAAKAKDIPEDTVAQLWEMLVEASIAYEFEQWDKRSSVN